MHTSYFVAVVALYVLMMSGIWSTSHTAPISMEAGELDVDNKNGVVNLLWSANVSTLYPPRYFSLRFYACCIACKTKATAAFDYACGIKIILQTACQFMRGGGLDKFSIVHFSE